MEKEGAKIYLPKLLSQFLVAVIPAKTMLFSGAIPRITQCIFFIGVCSFAHAANVNFSGPLNNVDTDNGAAIYSGVAIGTGFSGSISDVTLDGFITDGTTSTSLVCCIGNTVGLEVINNEPLEAEDAALLNSLAGTGFVGGDFVDIIILEVGALTPGGGQILVELALVFDSLEFNDASLDNYPPDLDDALIILFFIEEQDDQVETIYEAFGVVDELTFTEEEGFQINAGLNDAWVSADAPLQGFFFSVFPDLEFFFLSWFTFDSVPPDSGTAVFGAIDQRWVTGGGVYSGNSVTISVELTTGGVFNASIPMATQQPGYGTINIVFNNCNEAVLTYNFPSVGLSGEMTLTRALTDNVALCEVLAEEPGDLVLIAPHVQNSDVSRIDPFSASDDSPLGRIHDGLDFHVTRDLVPFQAACSGQVSLLELFNNEGNGNWQVNVGIECDSTFLAVYAFEPFSPDQADGQTQLGNIDVTMGQAVTQGDVIGRLVRSHEEAAHVHFGFIENFQAICPEPFFTADARNSILTVIRENQPGWEICF